MSASDLPAPPRARTAFWPTPDAMRLRARALFAPGTVLPVALDSARGVAALLVLAFHLRSWLMVPYAEARPHGPALAAFYAVTSFGHESVIVFFVLSGFLIGGAVLRMDVSKPGSVADYAAARLARIAPVLLGAVALSVAAWVFAPWGPASACHLTPGMIAGNLLALGNFGMPVLCNDMPLWSLSNEVAYYIAFPALVALIRGHRSAGVVLACLVVLAISAASLALTPWDQQNVVLYFPAWLAGAALWGLPSQRRWPVWPAAAGFAGALVASRLPGADRFFLVRDGLTTLAFAALLASLMDRRWPGTGRWNAVAGQSTAAAANLAAFSFSLYVTHNPVIELVSRWALHRGTVLPLSTISWPLLGGLFGACIGTALTFSQIFERPHRAVACWLRGALAG